MQMSIRRVDLELKCDSVYVPELMMHNITLTWDLSNQHPLAREALLAHEFSVYALNLILIPPEMVEVKFGIPSQVCFKLLYSGTSKSTYIIIVSLNSKVNGQNNNTGYYSLTFVLRGIYHYSL